MKMMEFIYKNTDSFILNTFGYLWESRNWWETFPVQLVKIDSDIICLHAYTKNNKAPGLMKTYYVVTHKAFRGQGLAKKLTIQSIRDSQYDCENYFVNSEENSPGVSFYKKLFNDNYTMTKNEFGTLDYNFQAPIKTLLLEHA
jgi:GNAT superfamily N-acetyltransferase